MTSFQRTCENKNYLKDPKYWSYKKHSSGKVMDMNSRENCKRSQHQYREN